MADELVERVTGQSRADLVPLRVDLIMTDQTLFNGGPRADGPATVSGYGPMPAPAARDLVTRTAAAAAAESEVTVRIRRLFTDPAGRLVTMETDSRDFTAGMAEFVKLRDQRCTTPWCGAPIRHIDHIRSYLDGGTTSLANAGGTCESCNYAKEAPGWIFTPQPDGSVRITTPTGHDPITFTRAQPPQGSGPQPSKNRARRHPLQPRPPASTAHPRTTSRTETPARSAAP